jgi:Cu(I)/Ag(I) efflux system membrane fusion protein
MTRSRSVILWSVVGVVVAVLLILTFRHKTPPPPGSLPAGGATSRAAAGQTDAMAGMGSDSAGSVVLTPQQISQLGVSFGTVALRPLSNEVRTVGTVVVNETRVAKVTPKFSGYVEKLYVNFVGQRVKRGEPLAAIFSPDLVAAEQELLVSARLSHTLGASTIPGVPGNTTDLLVAAKERLRLWDVSDEQINTVLASGSPMRTVSISSPASGFVMDKKVVQGQSIQAGEELYTIADLSDVWVEAQLREEDAGRVSLGATATLDFTSYPGRPFTGRVTYIDPMLGEQARTVKARITVLNTDARLKPGMYATVVLNSSTQSALTVPRSAVVQTGERALVFVDLGSGKLNAQTVRLGRTGGDYVEVLSGLASGQRVVTSAQFLIDSESNVAEVMRSMIGVPGQGGATSKMTPGAKDALDAKGADMRGMPAISPPAKK